ncbi:MAG: NAD(P)H-flavin reductase, partial [Burkholderiales bacterium]
PEATLLRLAPEGGPVDYLPGQFLKVRLSDGATRNFSMASPPGESALDLHVRRIPGGRFTDGMLGGLRPGDALELELPHGGFFMRRQDVRPLLFAVTGTGLAPVKAILESLLDDPDCPPVALYRGARTEAELYMDDTLRGWGGRLPDFRYVPVLSRAGAGWSGRRGHVQDAALADFADLSGHAIYLCGSPAMIGAARRAFVAQGASGAHIYADAFVRQADPTQPPSAARVTEAVAVPLD